MSHAAKIAISMETSLLKRLDHLVEDKAFKSRSQAIQIAVAKIIEHMDHQRLERECVKLDPVYEQKLAEEGLSQDVDIWSHY